MQFLHIFWQTLINTPVLSAQNVCDGLHTYVPLRVSGSESVSAMGICRLHPAQTKFCNPLTSIIL